MSISLNSYNSNTLPEDTTTQSTQDTSSVEVKDPNADSTTIATTNVASWAFALINTLGGQSATDCNNAKMESIEAQKDNLKAELDYSSAKMDELKDEIDSCSVKDVAKINQLNGQISAVSTKSNSSQSEGAIMTQGAANNLGSSMKQQQGNSDNVATLAKRMGNASRIISK